MAGLDPAIHVFCALNSRRFGGSKGFKGQSSPSSKSLE
jgi:hypothetical protein